MAKVSIVLADSDELFLNKLTDYFMEKTTTFDVCSFTSKESMVKYISDAKNKIDIIAFAEGVVDNAINEADIPAKILLSEGTYSNLFGYETVNKYQKAEKFINSILLIYAEKTGHADAVITGNKQTSVIGVYSPVGGCGKTTMALALSMHLADIGKRVFYLNYEIINSTTELLNTAPSGSLSDVFLSLKTKGANVGLRIIANKYCDNTLKFNFINPPESALELNELTIQEQIKLIKEFDSLGEFDAIVVDFSSEFGPTKIELLDSCDIILMPFTADLMSLSKIRVMLNEFRIHAELDDLFNKIHLAVNKFDAYSNRNLQNSGIPNIKPIDVSMPISPILSEIKNLSYEIGSMQNVFESFVNVVLKKTSN